MRTPKGITGCLLSVKPSARMIDLPVELETAIKKAIGSDDIARRIIKHIKNRIDNNYNSRDLEKIIASMCSEK